jgi:hypothetical protein
MLFDGVSVLVGFFGPCGTEEASFIRSFTFTAAKCRAVVPLVFVFVAFHFRL